MKKNIFKIFLTGLLIFLKNILPLSRAMLFPVFGQVIGIALILAPVYFYREYYLVKLTPEELQRQLMFLFLGLIIMVIPGFIIFIKAFWEYMIVMVSLNTMVSDIVEKKPAHNFKVHAGAVKLRTKDYLILLFILMGVWLVLTLAPFVLLILSSLVLNKILSTIVFVLSMVACLAVLAIVSVYLCLSFQIFAFEAISPIGVVKKSYEMINGNFWRAVVLGLVLMILTGAIIPTVFIELIKMSPVADYLVAPFEAYAEILLQNTGLIEKIRESGYTVYGVSKEFAYMSAGTFLTMFLLPLGSACFTLFYFDIKNCKHV